MARIEGRDEIGKGATAGVLAQGAERTRPGQVQRFGGIVGIRWGQGGRETEDGFILSFERLFDVVVQFPIGSGCLGCV